MAAYKVHQDVEAEDKLIGPFSFRQFMYLVIVSLGIAVAWVLAQIFIGLILIPMPVILFFGALALPLRRDQPMEVYLAAMIKFFFKPRIRLWKPEGQVNLVTIVAPHTKELPRQSTMTGTEAGQRLSYLAQVIDTQGWATRGITDTAILNLNDTITAEASTIDDMLDSSVGIGRQFDSLIEQQDTLRLQQATQQFQSAMHEPQSAPLAQAQAIAPSAQAVAAQPIEVEMPTVMPTFNPYPSSMRQHVISPRGAAAHQRPSPATVTPQQPHSAQQDKNVNTSASDNGPSPDIMRLASNKDLSISAIAREAHRLEDDGGEVVISLR